MFCRNEALDRLAKPVTRDTRPLAIHVLHRFDTGGLENGVVNLINHMRPEAWRHMVVAITEVTDFRYRLRRSDVECIALRKPPGHGFWLYPRFYRLLRQHLPTVVHTRNLAALEMQVAAWAAGVPVRIHGEHGRDVEDLDGTSRRYQRIRRLYSPFVHRYVALSQDLAGYLTDRVGIAEKRITQIYNGVDSDRFRPRTTSDLLPAGWPFTEGCFVIGTVGRMQTVKNQVLLANAFVRLMARSPEARRHVRLVMVGDGPLHAEVQRILSNGQVDQLAWLPGERRDVPELMRALDCFVLPSKNEGVSNSILEAMASGLPTLATAVGGNPELVAYGRTGVLVPPENVDAMADALLQMVADPSRAAALGRAGRAEVERRFSLQAMVGAYQRLYEAVVHPAR
jgi:sugar transferase (PEP-CTERM/EpsH1 system associated)